MSNQLRVSRLVNDLHVQTQPGAVVLTPSGRIDHATSEDFKQQLVPHLQQCTPQGNALVLDLSQLQYISSAGLRVLMLAAKQCKAAGGQIVVAAPTDVVSEILQISRFDLVFAVHGTVQQALHAVQSPPSSGTA